MKIIKVRSPFFVSVNETAQIGSKVELYIYNKGNSIPTFLSGVTVSTAGQFTCAAATFAVGNTVTISGTLTGTGTITGYTNLKTYFVIATNGTTTFTLSATLGGTALTTTAGTPTGLTYLTQISGYYALSKSIASTTQIENVYNISNYVREFIAPIKPTVVTVPTVEDNNNWAICIVKRYKETSGGYTLLDTNEYVCLDAFTTYNDGMQLAIDTGSTSPALVLNNQNVTSNYYTNAYLNVVCQRNTAHNFGVRYDDENNNVLDTIAILSPSASLEYFNYKIPFKTSLSSLNYQKFILFYQNVFFTKIAIKIDECKYTPVLCNFVNRLGGWEFLTFFKAQTNSIAVKGTDYKLMPNALNYNIAIGQNQRFNLNGTQTVKLNTGFVDENYSELITDLLLSETVLLDNKPVTLKTQGSDLKTVLKDRMINYEFEFEYAYNLINDVV